MGNLHLLPHEFHPVSDDDYPVTQDSIDRSREANRAERIKNGIDPDTGKLQPVSDAAYYEQWERLADMQTVFALARKYGGARVQKWIRNYERGGSL